jgi:hypothetical protein
MSTISALALAYLIAFVVNLLPAFMPPPSQSWPFSSSTTTSPSTPSPSASRSTKEETAPLSKPRRTSDSKKLDPPVGEPAAAIKQEASKKTRVDRSMVLP